MSIKPCYHENTDSAGVGGVSVSREGKALSPSHPSTPEDFPSERARDWVVGSERTNDEGWGA